MTNINTVQYNKLIELNGWVHESRSTTKKSYMDRSYYILNWIVNIIETYYY